MLAGFLNPHKKNHGKQRLQQKLESQSLMQEHLLLVGEALVSLEF
jgi:hypothetical protein